jgi:hypothetical protein
MATSRRKLRSVPLAETAALGSSPARRRELAADPWSSALRNQLECGMLGFVAMLESAEAMHRLLLDSTHSARKRHEALRARVHAAGSVEQLALAESELWQFDTDLLTRYWQDVGETVTHMNAELQAQASEALQHWFDDMLTPTAIGDPAGRVPAAPWLAPFFAAAR